MINREAWYREADERRLTELYHNFRGTGSVDDLFAYLIAKKRAGQKIDDRILMLWGVGHPDLAYGRIHTLVKHLEQRMESLDRGHSSLSGLVREKLVADLFKTLDYLDEADRVLGNLERYWVSTKPLDGDLNTNSQNFVRGLWTKAEEKAAKGVELYERLLSEFPDEVAQ